jgi:hypothetical protein
MYQYFFVQLIALMFFIPLFFFADDYNLATTLLNQKLNYISSCDMSRYFLGRMRLSLGQKPQYFLNFREKLGAYL